MGDRMLITKNPPIQAIKIARSELLIRTEQLKEITNTYPDNVIYKMLLKRNNDALNEIDEYLRNE